MTYSLNTLEVETGGGACIAIKSIKKGSEVYIVRIITHEVNGQFDLTRRTLMLIVIPAINSWVLIRTTSLIGKKNSWEVKDMTIYYYGVTLL